MHAISKIRVHETRLILLFRWSSVLTLKFRIKWLQLLCIFSEIFRCELFRRYKSFGLCRVCVCVCCNASQALIYCKVVWARQCYILPYKSFYWKATGELIQDTSPKQVHNTWIHSLSQGCRCLLTVKCAATSPVVRGLGMALTVLSSWCIWWESGMASKTKSKSVSVLHGCQGLKGCLFNTLPRED